MRIKCVCALALLALVVGCGGDDGGPGGASPLSTGPTPRAAGRAVPGAGTPVPAVAERPQGECTPTERGAVEVFLHAHGPFPECLQVRTNQRLTLISNLPETTTIRLPRLDLMLNANERETVEAPLGELFAPGVHMVEVTPPGYSLQIYVVAE